MTQRTLVRDPCIAVETAWALDARNPFSDDPKVKALVSTLVEHRMLLQAFAMFVVSSGKRCGYGHSDIGDVKWRLLRIPNVPSRIRNSLGHLLSGLSDVYEKHYLGGNQREKSRLSELFSSAICEAVAVVLLEKCKQNVDDILRDAHFSLDGDVTAKNIDIVWLQDQLHALEMYECKLHPSWLLDPYIKHNWNGHELAWRKSKLGVMLEYGGLLVKFKWKVRLFLVTLYSREFVSTYCTNNGQPPEELEICPLESLHIPFPPEALDVG